MKFKNKYERLIHELESQSEASMRCYGNSMTPIIKSGSLITFQKCTEPEINEKVMCRIGQKWIDCHLVTAYNEKRGWQISNNHGHINGWTKNIYAKAIRIELNGTIKEFK